MTIEMMTHKELFTEYLRAPRFEGQMPDWQEWLYSQDLYRCEITGLYGKLGFDVSYYGPTGDTLLCRDDIIVLEALAKRHSAKVEYNRHRDGTLFVTVTLKGGQHLDFSHNDTAPAAAHAAKWLAQKSGEYLPLDWGVWWDVVEAWRRLGIKWQ